MQKQDPSKLDLFLELPKDVQDTYLSSLSPMEKEYLVYDWRWIGRKKQQLPDEYYLYNIWMQGRGAGKSRTGSNIINSLVYEAEKQGKKITVGLVGATYSEILKVMVEGESGILNQSHPSMRPKLNANKGELIYPGGSVAYFLTGESPEKIRGFNLELVWIDEFSKLQYLTKVWQQLQFATGRTKNPRFIITTTPKPSELLKQLINHPKSYVVRGSSYENTHLSQAYLENINQYAGTRLGLQEIEAHILDDMKSGLWSVEMIQYMNLIQYQEKFHPNHYVKQPYTEHANKDFTLQHFLQDQKEVCIGVDPSVTANAHSDETGIVVCSRDKRGYGYVLEDHSAKMTTGEWTQIVSDIYNKYSKMNIKPVVIVERNNGGDLVAEAIKNTNSNIKVIAIHASKGKIARAEPVSLLYEQQKIFHMKTNFIQLESQMRNFKGKLEKYDEDEDKIVSPDRLDALVYSLSYLFGINSGKASGAKTGSLGSFLGY